MSSGKSVVNNHVRTIGIISDKIIYRDITVSTSNATANINDSIIWHTYATPMTSNLYMIPLQIIGYKQRFKSLLYHHLPLTIL